MIKTAIFDLDEILLNREKAIEQMFELILDKCYEDINSTVKSSMLKKFKEYDKESYGHNEKSVVFESFFDESPPKYRLLRSDIQDYWNNNFPNCFTTNSNTINIVNTLKKKVKVAIVTNGSTQRQKAKIYNTNLNSCFEIIVISE